jgi:NitT/TauT family transport system substrate-binding protein
MAVLSGLLKLGVLLGFVAALASSEAPAQTVRVKVASTAKEVFDNLPLFIARDKGIFKANGLDVEVAHFSGGGEVVRAVSSRSMQFGMVAATAAIIAAAAGQDLKIISAWSAPAYGMYFIVPAESPIKTAAELAGKKVGISRPGSITHTGLLTAAQNLNIKLEAVPVGSPGDSWIAMKSKRVDAGWQSVPDVYRLIDQGEARVLIKLEEHVRNYQQGALIAMADYLTLNADVARRLIRACSEAMAFIDKNPGEAAGIGSKVTGYSKETTLRTIVEMPKGFFRTGAVRSEHFKGSFEEAAGTGAMKAAISYDAVVDRSYLP